ncbi:MAG: histidine kinase [Nocardioides sp.]
MDRPSPEEYQPPLTLWMRAWRLVAMLLLSGFFWSLVVKGQREHPWALVLDLAVGALCFGLVPLRRRHPMPVAVVVNLLAVVSGTASGPALLTAASLATRRRPREVLPLAVVIVAASSLFYWVQPFGTESPWWQIGVYNVAFATIQLGWGMYLGSRRELFWELSRRAEQAEADRDERADRARDHERARIAREMHDVLAHRISQISLHAGAMAFREDLTQDEMRRGATVIQQSANGALTDLRGVLGVLRDDTTGLLTDPPQPTYADVHRLVESARTAGMRIDFTDGLERGGDLNASAGRTVYRIIQEGLTNASKHAPGALVTLEVTGGPDTGAEVSVRNAVGFSGPATPASGLGLIGLTERADLSGGWLDHGEEGDTFHLQAWIPWVP